MPKTIRSWQRDIHALAKEKGWWENDIPKTFCTIHGEVSKAFEEYYKGRILDLYYNKDKPEGMFVELADVMIQILNLAERAKIDLEHIMTLKHQYNKTREHRHGSKKA